MKTLLIALVLLASQVSFAANECFIQQQVRNWRAPNDSTIEIDAGRKDYVLEVGYCPELRWSHRIAFDSFSGSRVCRGDKVLVLDTFSNQIKDVCRIFKVTRVN